MEILGKAMGQRLNTLDPGGTSEHPGTFKVCCLTE